MSGFSQPGLLFSVPGHHSRERIAPALEVALALRSCLFDNRPETGFTGGSNLVADLTPTDMKSLAPGSLISLGEEGFRKGGWETWVQV